MFDTIESWIKHNLLIHSDGGNYCNNEPLSNKWNGPLKKSVYFMSTFRKWQHNSHPFVLHSIYDLELLFTTPNPSIKPGIMAPKVPDTPSIISIASCRFSIPWLSNTFLKWIAFEFMFPMTSLTDTHLLFSGVLVPPKIFSFRSLWLCAMVWNT